MIKIAFHAFAWLMLTSLSLDQMLRENILEADAIPHKLTDADYIDDLTLLVYTLAQSAGAEEYTDCFSAEG